MTHSIPTSQQVETAALETYRPVKRWGVWHAWVERRGEYDLKPLGVQPDAETALAEARDLYGMKAVHVVETIERQAA